MRIRMEVGEARYEQIAVDLARKMWGEFSVGQNFPDVLY